MSRPPAIQRTRITHVIGDLALGGAERLALALSSQLDTRQTDTRVITLLAGGPLARVLEEQGVTVEMLGMRRTFPIPGPSCGWPACCGVTGRTW